MSELVLPAAVAGQLAFHARMAAAAAVARGDGEADTEALLAWTILVDTGVDAPLADLPGPRIAKASTVRLEDTCRRTEALALELQAHFVSEGQGELAELYARAATRVQDAASQLRTP
jgi:hypothetical protein